MTQELHTLRKAAAALTADERRLLGTAFAPHRFYQVTRDQAGELLSIRGEALAPEAPQHGAALPPMAEAMSHMTLRRAKKVQR
ncbi:hypothetical protein [Schleiferilactobacillus shenzhenensis]|uniref:Uncharacterized protein n=1 Tax=Schleiferilactobacillus shenzhenensis LY-73 TaxID=1231336 RepID=U4TNC3_9LACO|nr:hypothetical protein [Schleiferilactobacillus shenzhenensis]ERL66371.1 hypothetical protein L248_0050 [Schleiferilactobacillus shenzhenensis LY-73]